MSLDELNAPQREAVLHGEGPLLILAGAGSGKTRVITHRLASLVRRGVPPWRLLAVTFTNKAAGEMRERAARLLDEDEARRMWIGTFHSISARLLRAHAPAVGLSADFQIYDDDDQRRLVVRVMADAGITDRAASPRQILSRIDQAKNEGVRASDFVADDYLTELVSRVYPEYQRRLRAANAVDFGDLILEALRLAEHPEVGAALGARFAHVLVDEFQDTNRTQYQLVRRLCRSGNLCVVGDDDQAIYRWRGADVRNILEFDRDHPGCAVVKLEQNYRSTEIILAAANGVIAKNLSRKSKKLFTEIAGGEPVIYFTATDERREAEFIVGAIRRLVDSEGREPTDFAVLYRTHAQSRAIEEALRSRDLPYTVFGGMRFFDRAEVKDLLGYLRVIANPADEVSLERIVNAPPRGIGDATMATVSAHARATEKTLYQAMRDAAEGRMGRAATEAEPLFGIFEEDLDEEDRAVSARREGGSSSSARRGRAGRPSPDISTGPRRKLAAFVELVEKLRAHAQEGPGIAALAATTLEWSGMHERMKAEESSEALDRLANLDELVNSIRDYEQEAPSRDEEPTLVGYLERVSLVSSGDARGKGVTLMTVHAAKGLEFPVVFLAGLEEGTFPMIRGDDGREKIEEERRLAYVAITRARERLVLTNAANRRLFRGGEARVVGSTPLLDEDNPYALRESRFVGDVPEECIARPVTARPRVRDERARGPRLEHRGDGVYVEREDEPDAPLQRRAPVDRDGGDSGGRERRVEYEEGARSDGEGAFRVGQRVRHATFGEGRVKSFSGAGTAFKIVIDFAAVGPKTLMGADRVARFVEPA